MPSLCPVCRDPMLNDYLASLNANKTVLRKSCKRRLNHRLYIESVPGEDDNIRDIYLVGGDYQHEISWNLDKRYVSITRWHGKLIENNPIILPFFEPNFSNLKSLYTKLKLCITFS